MTVLLLAALPQLGTPFKLLEEVERLQALGAHRSQSIPFNPEFVPASESLVQRFAFSNAAQMVFGNEETGEKCQEAVA